MFQKRNGAISEEKKKLALLLLRLFAFKEYMQNIKQTRENIWIYIEYFNPFVKTVIFFTCFLPFSCQFPLLILSLTALCLILKLLT